MERIAEGLESVLPRYKLDIFGKDSLLHNTFPFYLLALLINLSQVGAG